MDFYGLYLTSTLDMFITGVSRCSARAASMSLHPPVRLHRVALILHNRSLAGELLGVVSLTLYKLISAVLAQFEVDICQFPGNRSEFSRSRYEFDSLTSKF